MIRNTNNRISTECVHETSQTNSAAGINSNTDIEVFQGRTSEKREYFDITNELIDCFSHRKFDKAKEIILNEINAENVAQIWKMYNNSHAKKFSKVNVSIPNKIYENYNSDDAKKLLDHMVKIMKKAGEKRGIDLSEHIKLYNEAYSRNVAWYNPFARTQKTCDIENAVIRMGNELVKDVSY